LPVDRIERDELAVKLSDEHLVVADRDALVVPAAADRGDAGSSFASYCQRTSPPSSDSANTSLAPVLM
jgi:hypothetical protein